MSQQTSELTNCINCREVLRYVREATATITAEGAQARWLCPNCGLRVPGPHVLAHETAGTYNLGADKASTKNGAWSLKALAAPAAPAGVGSGTGGTLTAATYVYKITALNAAGETTASPASANVVIASGTTNKVTVTWTAVTGATGYKLYGRTGGNFKLIATVGAVTTTIDDGSATPGVNAPTANTAVTDDGTLNSVVKP